MCLSKVAMAATQAVRRRRVAIPTCETTHRYRIYSFIHFLVDASLPIEPPLRTPVGPPDKPAREAYQMTNRFGPPTLPPNLRLAGVLFCSGTFICSSIHGRGRAA